VTPRRRRLRAIAVATLAVLVVGLGLGQAFRDVTAPELWVEAPDRVPTGEPFELRLSASEPAAYRIVYGDVVVEAVDQDLVVPLAAQVGRMPVRIEAADAAGNVGTAEVVVEGVAIAAVELRAPERVVAGTPFSVEVALSPAEAAVVDLALAVDGVARPLHGAGVERWALAAAPLADAPVPSELSLSWRDGLDRAGSAQRRVAVDRLEGEVQELNVPAATLSVITPEARALEAETLAAAAPDPADPPRWSEPFLLPVEGRGSSGFARARRYAPGGPVSFHEGEDIAAPTGTPIRATNAGVVVVAGPFPIKGGMTVIDHGAGVTSRYYHQSRIDVRVGDVVERGQVIGAVGSTGLSTGPHLHWEMRVAGVASDPLAWVGSVRP
jgi:murein DD-endopeptidase MepM/ murein hydrolase activator NlpD